MKTRVFSFEIQYHVITSVYNRLTSFKLGVEFTAPKVFPSLLPQISTDRLRTFCPLMLYYPGHSWESPKVRLHQSQSTSV